MKINLRLTYEGKEPKEITCSARDLVAFEEKFDRSVAKLENEFRITDLFFLAWHSEHRRGDSKKSFEDWLDTVELVEASEQSPK
jgi:hypothetical protein